MISLSTCLRLADTAHLASRLLAGEFFPAPDDHIASEKIDLEQKRPATGLLCCQQRLAIAGQQIENGFALARGILRDPHRQLDRLVPVRPGNRPNVGDVLSEKHAAGALLTPVKTGLVLEVLAGRETSFSERAFVKGPKMPTICATLVIAPAMSVNARV